MQPVVIFEDVSKKFRRGQNHDSLRDLVPSLVRGAWRRSDPTSLGAREFWALRDVSFEVRPGEALGIIGANGAGKSTTLKLLTRILRPTAGRAAIIGRAGALIEVAAGFHPELTGRENVFLQGAIMGMKRPEIAARFDEIVEFAGVAQFVDTPVKRYSSGMNARLGFSVAAHLSPDVLVIDEVLAVGDMQFQQRCYERMREYKKQGVAIVLVSHNLQAISSLCDRTLLLAGHVEAIGETADVLDRYVQGTRQPATATSAADGISKVTGTLAISGQPPGRILDVEPGIPLTLTMTGDSEAPLDDVTFGVMIERSADRLLVFRGEIHRRDLGQPQDFQGEFALDFTFRANLVRGHYSVLVYLQHTSRQAFLVPPMQVATFSIHELASREGLVHVDLTARLRESLVPSVDS